MLLIVIHTGLVVSVISMDLQKSYVLGTFTPDKQTPGGCNKSLHEFVRMIILIDNVSVKLLISE